MPPTTYTVTATADANGSISPSGASTVTSGQTKSFTVAPGSGYQIASVSGCGGSLTGTTYTTGAITGACTVAASFSLTPPTTFAIPGRVTLNGAALPDVLITLTTSGSASTTATTSSSGTYSFTGKPNGSYTITPSLAGYAFTPASQTITLNGADAATQDFTTTNTGSIQVSW
jgi:hypothetical protein